MSHHWRRAAGAYGIVVHRRGGVDDAVAAVEGGAEAVPVEQVHLQHGEALRRAVERPQVRVLGVICATPPTEPNRKSEIQDRRRHKRQPKTTRHVSDTVNSNIPGDQEMGFVGIARGTGRWNGDREAGSSSSAQGVPARREVPRTAYPRARSILTIHDPMKPPAPVTHTTTAIAH